jgi:RNA-directed DNA polymerase
MMHGHGKSDSPIVPTKPPNEVEPETKEAVEGRELAKGNSLERNMPRTQSRQGTSSALERIRQATTMDTSERFYHSYPLMRFGVKYLRQEPDAVIPHVRICAGGRP